MSSKILVGFLAGAAVGALAGILFAPDKGSNTRRKIATKTGDLTESVKNSFSDFIDGVKETYAGAKEDTEEFSDKAKAKLSAAKNEMKNALS
jgi:gas vesicle protein